MRQKASERPVKEPRDRRKSDVLLTNMMGLNIETNGYNCKKSMCWVLIAGRSDKGPMVKNASLDEEQDDSRSTRDEEINDCREQQRRRESDNE